MSIGNKYVHNKSKKHGYTEEDSNPASISFYVPNIFTMGTHFSLK